MGHRATLGEFVAADSRGLDAVPGQAGLISRLSTNIAVAEVWDRARASPPPRSLFCRATAPPTGIERRYEPHRGSASQFRHDSIRCLNYVSFRVPGWKEKGGRVLDARPIDTSQLVVADEAEVCSVALPGLTLDVIRTGAGHGPNITRSRDFGDVVIASRVIQFPIVGRTDIADHRILAVLITAAPEGSRWCEIDVEPGTVLLYGSGSEHTEVSPPGLSFSSVLIDCERLEELADQLDLPLRLPGKGMVDAFGPSPSVRTLAAVLSSRRNPLTSTAFGPTQGSSALHAVAAALSEDAPNGRIGRSVKIDSGHVVRVCIEYVDSIGRTPSVAELCLVAHVSERLLRGAFTDTVGLSPLRYFRYRLLNRARERLIDADEGHETVSEIAIDLGFTHLGRFASRYEQLFGELPSATLWSLSPAPLPPGR